MGDFSFLFGGAFGNSNISELENKYGAACEAAAEQLFTANAGKTGFGWLALPDGADDEIKSAGEWLKGFEAVVHIGIGGSALGSLMLNQALCGVMQGNLSPEYYIADNPDPQKLLEIYDKVKNKKTAIVCVSKSGQTAETMTQFLWLCSKFCKGGNYKDSVLVITDKEKGLLKAFADETGCRMLVVPDSVGGRYSVLSSVGLAGAYAVGIDTDKLLSGAKDMREKLLAERSMKNPAWLYAVLHRYHEENGKNMAVLMPYSSSLVCFAEWFAQLWGESLGKNGTGMTPVRVSGAIDQHSQLQLYTEGPDDKVITVISLKNNSEKVFIPKPQSKALAGLDFFENTELGDMLSLEAKATAASLMKSGRPVIWLELDRLDEFALGGLIFFFEYVTAFTGLLGRINPFDQPGVEQGKRYTYGLLGRKGYENEAEEVKTWFAKAGETAVKL